jgi:hypothetical protein
MITEDSRPYELASPKQLSTEETEKHGQALYLQLRALVHAVTGVGASLFSETVKAQKLIEGIEGRKSGQDI